MFLRETVERCSRCEEVTPHCRRLVSLPKLVSVLGLVGAGWCFSQDLSDYPLGGVLLLAAVLLLLFDRERFWGVHCARCRGKKLAALRGTKPTLDGNTEILPL